MEYFKQIEKYEYVSFDLFDTLIFRTFSSYNNVYEFVECCYNRENTNRVKNFCKDRIYAEKKARKEKKWKEVTINEIYRMLRYPEEVANELKKLECQVEIDNCVPNKEMIDLVNYCHVHKKKVIVTTDMYLPRECIESIIKKIKVECDEIFISSEIGETKSSGELFDFVVEKLKIDRADIVHIGDNVKSDYERAVEKGINAICYKRNSERFSYLMKNETDIHVNHVNSLIRNGYCCFGEESPWYKLGFSVVGPVVIEFCRWIHEQREVQNLECILFLAREGYVIKRCYEELYPDEKDSIYYARLNKHVLRLPVINENNYKNILLSSIKNYKRTNWSEILNCLDIDEYTFNDEISILFSGVDMKQEFSLENIDTEEYNSLFVSLLHILKPKILEQENLLDAYLRSFDIVDKRIGLVNNSYSGNGQKLLETFVEKKHINCTIHGLQLAGNKKCKLNLGERYTTWLPNTVKESLVAYKFERASLVFEHFLFEPEGTALKMKQLEDGKVEVVCEEPRSEKQNFLSMDKLHQGVYAFIALQKDNLCCQLGHRSIMYFVNLVQKPDCDDAMMIGGIFDDDTEGDREIIDFSLPFNMSYLYKGDIYNKISWIQGYLRGKRLPDVYRILFNVRVVITGYIHQIKKG